MASLDYDDYVGRLAIGRVFNGWIEHRQEAVLMTLDGSIETVEISDLYSYDGLKRVKIKEAGPGDIIAVSGIDRISIGETIASPKNPKSLPGIRVDEPTMAVVMSVNDSPLSGRDGASRRVPSEAVGRGLCSQFAAWFPGGATVFRP